MFPPLLFRALLCFDSFPDLAKDYAILSGGNVLGLKEDAVPELRRVFAWAQRLKGIAGLGDKWWQPGLAIWWHRDVHKGQDTSPPERQRELLSFTFVDSDEAFDFN